jgi:20S proteasome alpha/beta subunit
MSELEDKAVEFTEEFRERVVSQSVTEMDRIDSTFMNRKVVLLSDAQVEIQSLERENKEKITIQEAIEVIHDIFNKFITFDSEDDRSNFVIELADEFQKHLNIKRLGKQLKN